MGESHIPNSEPSGQADQSGEVKTEEYPVEAESREPTTMDSGDVFMWYCSFVERRPRGLHCS